MPYSDTAKIKSRAPVGLADLTNDEAAPAIAWADARIDGRLRARYVLPFTATPPELAEVSADLAAYFVLNERFIAGAEDTPVEAATELKQRAELELQLMAEGKVILAVDGTTATTTSGVRSSTYGTRPSLRYFDGYNRPTPPVGQCPAPPLVPMHQTAPEWIDNTGGGR